MKIRKGFVSNSSSSSFVVLGNYISLSDITLDLIKNHEIYFLGNWMSDGQDIVQIETEEQFYFFKHFIRDDGDGNFVLSYIPVNECDSLTPNVINKYIDGDTQFKLLNFEKDYYTSETFDRLKEVYLDGDSWYKNDDINTEKDFQNFIKCVNNGNVKAFFRDKKLGRINEKEM